MENRKYVKFWAPVITLGLFLISFNIGYGYDLGAHELLTDTAIKIYNKNSLQKIDSGLNSFIIDGVRREDDPPRWMNHFYDPVYERGLSEDSAIDPFYKLGNWQESKLWVQDKTNQNKIKYSPVIATILSSIQSGKIEKFLPTSDFTWNKALKYWIQGDKEMAMFTLGHVLHLIQDISVPAHTRNDPHPGDSPYENYASQFNLSNPDTQLIGADLMPASLSDINSYFTQLATYSNNNFYSKDTIGIQSGYDSPTSEQYIPTYNNGQMEYYIERTDSKGDLYDLAVKKSTGSNYITEYRDFISIDNSRVKSDYWHLLSKKAVEYSAGVINLFFQEAEKNKDNPEFTKKDAPSLLGQITQTMSNGFNSVKDFISGVFGGGQFNQIDIVSLDDPQNSTSDQPPADTENDTGAKTKTISQNNTQSNSGKSDEKLYKVTRVIDGDTIVLENGTVIRYIGIDAPELSDTESKNDCLAKEARERNKQLVLNKNVRLEYGPQKTDIYDRTLAYVWIQDTDVNAVMIKEGFAYAYNFNHPHPQEDEYVQLQNQAKEAGVGIWGNSCGNNQESATSTDNESQSNSNTNESQPKACVYSTTQPPSHGNLQINEVAWMGSANSSSDEWIELKNSSSSAIALSGYWLIGRDNKIEIDLSKASTTLLQPSGFLLLERTDDKSVPGISADAIYSGSLGNSNEGLRLFAPGCILVDEVSASPSWPAGDNNTKKTMERNGQDLGWHSSLGAGGTPKQENSFFSTVWTGGGGGGSSSQSDTTSNGSNPTPQFFPVVINEIMYNPESTDADHEWIEILNNASVSVDISEWKLFENETNHALTLIDGSLTIPSGGFAIIADNPDQFKSDYPTFNGSLFKSSFSLSNAGETIAIKNGELKIDEVLYDSESGANGNGKSLQKFEKQWDEAAPTPGLPNVKDLSESRQSVSVNHLLISEIQTGGENPDDEFIEFYNPTPNPISLAGYSIQYVSGKATSTKNVYKKSIEPPPTVPSFGFALLANQNGLFSQKADALYNFSLSGESTGGIIILSNSTSSIESINDANIVDSVAYGNVAMIGMTGSFTPEKNQSLERKALFSGSCISPNDEGEFLGNGCDTNDNSYDFEIRRSPRPQGLANLLEPRNAPLAVQNFLTSYKPKTTEVGFAWETPNGDTTSGPYEYEIDDFETNLILATTTSLSFIKNIDEIGRNYVFSVKVADREGLQSNISTSTVYVPSFLKSLSVFKDATNENEYITEGLYDQLPLVSNVNPVGDVLVFFLNKDAAKESTLSGDYTASSTDGGPVEMDYHHCSGVSGSRHFFAITTNPCPQIGMMAEAIPQEYLEDKMFSLKNNPNSPLNSSDYFTVAFYTFGHSNLWSGGTDVYRLAAVDKTKYYVSETVPPHSPPDQIQNFKTELNDQDNPYVVLKWDDANDSDSIDQFLTYEYNFSKDGAPLDDSNWTETKKGFAQSSDGQGGLITIQTAPQVPLTESGSYTFYIRAKDDLGLVSTSSISNVDLIIPSFLAGVSDNACNYCNTTNFATTQGAANPYKIGQTFLLQAPARVTQIQMDLHNFAAPSDMNVPPSSFDAKVSVNSMADVNDPNAGLTEISSVDVTNIPAMIFPNKNYMTIKFPSPINLGVGKYFIKLETVGGTLSHPSQGIAVSTTGSDKYSQGQAYFINPASEYPPSVWAPMNFNLYFKVLGTSQ